MKIASVADVKAHLSAYIKASEDELVVITKNGKPVVVAFPTMIFGARLKPKPTNIRLRTITQYKIATRMPVPLVKLWRAKGAVLCTIPGSPERQDQASDRL